MKASLDSYMDTLRKKRDARLTEQKSEPTLIQQISNWWDTLSEVQRLPYYNMTFLVNTFGYASSKIGPALYELGWQRRRSWQKNKPFCRVWVPPTQKK